MVIISFSKCGIVNFLSQLEDGHTLFDYDVGLNDIVQLMIRPNFTDSKPSRTDTKETSSWNGIQINGTDKKEVMNGDSQCESDEEAMDTDSVGITCMNILLTLHNCDLGVMIVFELCCTMLIGTELLPSSICSSLPWTTHSVGYSIAAWAGQSSWTAAPTLADRTA